MNKTDAWSAVQGGPISDNNYKVDLSHDVVVGPARKVALGGAYTAIAEGVESLADNPAGVAFRPSYSNGYWDWDGSLGWFPIGNNDFENSGNDSIAYSSHQIVNLGLLGQYGRWGLGLYGNTEQYDVVGNASSNRYNLSDLFIALGASIWERQLTLGIGIRPVSFNITPLGNDSLKLLDLSGSGTTFGMVWHPERGAFRMGLSFSSSIASNQNLPQGGPAPIAVNGLIVPSEVTIPVEGAIGISYQFKVMNLTPLLLAFDVRASGPVDNAVGVNSFLEQTVQPKGESVSVGYHTGIESEVIPGRLILRLGDYLEPSRFSGVSARNHITGGIEVRVFKFYVFGERHLSISYAYDVARQYFVNFVSLGFWHF
ncbi:MAG: hypothetical protein HYR80_08420 [Nitrospirae bacterium]|nr:hypothetical protein [Nitrospirota bacterium]